MLDQNNELKRFITFDPTIRLCSNVYKIFWMPFFLLQRLCHYAYHRSLDIKNLVETPGFGCFEIFLIIFRTGRLIEPDDSTLSPCHVLKAWHLVNGMRLKHDKVKV